MLSHRVIFHGRRICHARKPACGACPIAPLCPAYGEGETDPEKAKKLLKYEKGGFPGQRLKPPPAYLDAGGSPRPRWAPDDGTGHGPGGRWERAGTGVADDDARATTRDASGTQARSGDRLQGRAARVAGPGGARRGDGASRAQLSRFLPPADGAGRQSAVLILFGEGARGPELLLMERAGTLRSHAGQPSFPGGALDPEDGDPAGRRARCARRCARPRRRPASTRPVSSSSACCPGSTSRSAASS